MATRAPAYEEDRRPKPREQKSESAASEGTPPTPVSPVEFFQHATFLDVGLLLLGSVAALVLGIIQPGSLVLFGALIDQIGSAQLQGNADATEDLVNAILELFLYLGVVAFGAGAIATACFRVTGERQALRYRRAYLDAILRQDVGWHDMAANDGLSARFATDTQLVEQGIGTKLSEGLRFLGQGVGGIAVAFWFRWQVALLVLAFSPMVACSTYALVLVNSSLAQAMQQAFSAAAAVAGEALSAIRTVASFGGEARELRRFDGLLEPAEKTGIQGGWRKGLAFAAIDATGNMAFATGIIFAGYQSAAERMRGDTDCAYEGGCQYTSGGVVLAIFGVVMGSQGLGLLGPSLGAFTKARAAAGSMRAVVSRTPPIDAMSPAGAKPASVRGRVDFRAVAFSYPTRPDVRVYTAFNLAIEPGQTVALVGGSGSGKSTAVQLLERFYDPDAGTVELDGTDIRTLNLAWYRAQIGLVSQEPVLFDGTIADNIAYGRPGASRAEVEAAARSANAHGFISAMPQGYDTRVGNRGGTLSGGQKQRVAIARALIKNPKILILDEATSALDSESERVVQEALDQLMAEARTTLVIAHRLSTIRTADKIVVVGNGGVLEEGSHEELLMVPGGHYAALVAANETKRPSATDGAANGS